MVADYGLFQLLISKTDSSADKEYDSEEKQNVDCRYDRTGRDTRHKSDTPVSDINFLLPGGGFRRRGRVHRRISRRGRVRAAPAFLILSDGAVSGIQLTQLSVIQ